MKPSMLTVAVCCSLMLPASGWAQRSGPAGNLPLPPETLQRRLQDDAFQITANKAAGGGVMGAHKLTLSFPDDGFTTDVKWKVAPHAGDGWNNSPRREIGAYVVQQLFLDPDDYVVPPIAVRCIPVDAYRAVDAHQKPNLDGTACVYGTMSAWLRNVRPADPPLDPDRFSHDARYAYHVGHLNLLTYLIKHKDAKPGNMLISTDPANPQVFSVDNGIAFGHVLFNFFALHLNRLVIGGVPKQSLERLRRVTRADLDRLGVLGELRVDKNGVLRSVPPSANVGPSAGERTLPDGIQFGLTTEEIDEIEERLRQLRVRVGEGELATF